MREFDTFKETSPVSPAFSWMEREVTSFQFTIDRRLYKSTAQAALRVVHLSPF